MASINYWPTTIRLDPHLKNDMKLFYIFGDEIILVTNKDDVYVYGNKMSGLSAGLGAKQISMPTKVDVLCQKNICHIISGNNRHVVALTATGFVYTWGQNDKSQLGIGSTDNDVHGPQVIPFEERIEQICCGDYHTLALTRDGDVFVWGDNQLDQCGDGTKTTRMTPTKIPSLHNIISIASGAYHSLALNNNGQVFVWGMNKCVQSDIIRSGFYDRSIRSNYRHPPVRVIVLDSIFIKKISCGSNHNLLLSNDGSLYSFGDNTFGQLGNSTTISQSTVTKIFTNNCNAFKLIDVAASHHENISIAKRDDGKCFVWGKLNSENFNEPKETDFTSMDDVFGVFTGGKMMMRSARVRHDNNRILENMSKSFNNKENYDLRIKVGDQYIYCHKFFLKIQCQHFNTMFGENWDKDTNSEIQLNQYSHKVYYAFIEFLYKNEVNVGYDEVFDLLDLSNAYFEEDLKRRCSDIIKEQVSVENVASIYSAAVKFNAYELRNFCSKFSHDKMNDILETEAFNQMDVNLIKGFLRDIRSFGAFITNTAHAPNFPQP